MQTFKHTTHERLGKLIRHDCHDGMYRDDDGVADQC